jgi:MFS family permease
MTDTQSLKYRWIILGLTAITGTLAVSIPTSCLPSLFKEISDDLGLSLVELGTIWGMGNLAAFFINIYGGFLVDRFGSKGLLVTLCLLAGITGALRGLSAGFLMLAVAVFMNSLIRAIIPIVSTKMIGIWFRGFNLATANGVGAMGMGLGLTLGPMISATYLSPALGGWRHVLFLYGGVSIAMAVVWTAFWRKPPAASVDPRPQIAVPFRQALTVLLKNKALWFVGFTVLFRSASVMGMMGYLPLYLRGQGWAPADADGALAAFFAASTISVIPLTMLSDRIGSRRAIMYPALVLMTLCVGLLSVAHGPVVWVLVVLGGMTMDGFLAIAATYVLETRGVGQANMGTAVGLVWTISQPGGIVGPPIGNSFASFSPGAPFIFWAALSLPALITLFFAREANPIPKDRQTER